MNYQVNYNGKFFKGLSLEMKSPSHSTKITYEVGKTYGVDDFDTSDKECSTGIHVVTSLALALKWGPKVIEVSVPEDALIVWGPDKVRVSRATVLSEVNLGGADLGGADLGGADLGGADLGGANLGGANLGGANLRGANLGGADLGGAYLGGADLGGADLGGAYLGDAYLGGADLGGADLGGAYLGGADLGGALYLEESIHFLRIIGEPASLPEGWRYDKGLIVPGPVSS